MLQQVCLGLAASLATQVAHGQHGLWLLYAERGGAEHRRLREQLGLPALLGAAHEEFVIVRMRSGRIAATYLMPPPFSYPAVAAFAAAFARDELRPEGWQKELVRWAPVWLPLLLLLLLLTRGKRPAAAPDGKAAEGEATEARPEASVPLDKGKAKAE